MGHKQLPREVLKWVQSLDLSYAVRSTKRDFSNGYLVAEILSRYYDQEVSIHSYDNGSSSTCKFSNWNHLRTVFRKIGFKTEVDELQLIEAVIEARSADAIVAMILELYHFLTSRTVDTTVFKRPEGYKPQQLEENWFESSSGNQESKVTESLLGDADIPRAAPTGFPSNSIDEYSTGSAMDSNSLVRAATSKVLRGQPRKVRGAGAPSAQVVVKKVGVKPLNRNVAELRASRDESHNSRSTEDGSLQHSSLTQSLGEGSQSMGGSRSSGSKVNGAPGQFLEHMDHVISESTTAIKPLNATAMFALCLQENSIKQEAIVAVFEGIERNAPQLAADCVKEPVEFNLGAKMFSNGLSNPDATCEAFKKASLATCAFGLSCSATSAHDAWSMFCDYLFDRLVQVARERGTARHWTALVDAARSFGACLSNTEHVLLRLLRELPEPTRLTEVLRCMVHLLQTLEPVDDAAGRKTQESILPSYQYYVVCGLTHSSPSNRALAIQLLGELVKRGSDLNILIETLPLLESLYDDPWWEISTQLALLGVTLIQDSRTAQNRDMYAIAEGLVLSNFSPDHPLALKKIMLCKSASFAHQHSSLLQRYIDVLFGLPVDILQSLLSVSSNGSRSSFSESESNNTEEKLESPSQRTQRTQCNSTSDIPNVEPGVVSEIEYNDMLCPSFTWDGLAVVIGYCDVLEQNAKHRDNNRGLNRNHTGAQVSVFDEQSTCLLSACMRQVANETDPSRQEKWVKVYDRISDELLSSLLDESIVRAVISLLTDFAECTPVGVNVLRHPGWPSVMEKLYCNAPLPECSPVVAHFVLSFVDKGSHWKSATRAMLEETITQFPQVEDQNYMRKFLQAVE